MKQFKEKERYELELICTAKKSLGRIGNVIELKDKKGNYYEWHTHSNGHTVTFINKYKFQKVLFNYKYFFNNIHYISYVTIKESHK